MPAMPTPPAPAPPAPASLKHLALVRLDVTQDYLVREFVDNYEDGVMRRQDLLERVLRITGSTTDAAGVLLALGVRPLYADPLAQGTGGQAGIGEASPAPTSPFSVPPDDPSVTADSVTIPSGDALIQGYWARPAGDGSFPAVMICHENQGTSEHFRDVARRFAKNGYVALHLDLLSRQGGTEAVPPNQRGALFSGPGTAEQWVADFRAAMAFLRRQDFVRGDRIGMTGYCFGGGVTWNVAAREPTLKAAAPYYGVPAFMEELHNARAAILGVYGAEDQRVNATKDAVEAQLRAAGGPYRLVVYPNAGHGFFNDTRPQSYSEPAATAAWQDTLAWFEEHLRG
jgi:carboxymethylenebutenolidase